MERSSVSLRRLSVLLAISLISAGSVVAQSQEIGFIEDFSLAADRDAVLTQLIPGTEEYYFYHCLHYQNNQQFDRVEELLAEWIRRHNVTGSVRQIQNRQALLRYERQPQQTLAYLQKQLSLRFNHQRDTVDRAAQLPTALDPKLISHERLTQDALRRHRNNLNGFEDSALDWLAAESLDAARRRDLIKRLQRPDVPGLAKLVIDDLNTKNSSGFGSFNIHRNLVKAQLDELLEIKSALRNQTNFVNVYLSKLCPSPDVDWQNDIEAQKEYLSRLWDFAKTLAPTHNSLKAHVLYHQLVIDELQGKHVKSRFIAYLKLPRAVGYANPDYLKLPQNQQNRVNLAADFRSVTQHEPIGNDQSLVRRYLQHFFVDATNYREFAPYLNDVFLKHLFAETKIVNGLGDQEKWYSQLPPSVYKELKERVDIDFALTNPQHIPAKASVGMDVYVKNVPNLIIKVYRINALNYFKDQQREVNANINLDGLIPNEELTYEYDDPPLRRVRRHFEFESLSRPGVYLIDFIGNGRSSRALIQKGKLRQIVRTAPSGQSFVVFDEDNRRLPNASLWMGDRLYTADANGEIVVPFSTRPTRQPIILIHDDTVTLSFFRHLSEAYSLQAGFYIERESLLSGRVAKLLVRPGVRLNGIPMGVGLLQHTRLDISSIDEDGVVSTDSISDLELQDDAEYVHEFRVPPRLATIGVTLHAQVKSLSENKQIDLQASDAFTVNQIDKTHRIEELHFSKSGPEYRLEMLGKTGEPRPNRAVQLNVKHRDFRQPVNVALRSDRHGFVQLGTLQDISFISASTPDGTSRQWNLAHNRNAYHQTISGVAGNDVILPYSGIRQKADRAELSLLETRQGTFVADRFEAIKIENGRMVLRDLQPGDYTLTLKHTNRQILVRVAQGQSQDGFVTGQFRQLELRGQQPVYVDSIKVGKKSVDITVKNVSPLARVHIFATNFRPAFDAFSQLSKVRDAEPTVALKYPSKSRYVEGRLIGDEFRYILERKYAEKFPGNMLSRPELLLNPWAIRDTETKDEELAAGSDFEATDEARSESARRADGQARGQSAAADPSNLDFLVNAAIVRVNAKPDDKGLVRIDRDTLAGKQSIFVVAVDPLATSLRMVDLPESDPERLDRRLAKSLTPSAHFSQQKQISLIDQGQEFTVDDIRSGRFEIYDSLTRVHQLYQTLNALPQLSEFQFILRWAGMPDDEKRELYTKHACHELNFFIQRKDPQFFAAVVQPYLRNKLHKTFFDHYLLENDLGEYLSPWNYRRLNVVERILLARRIAGEQPITADHLKNLADLIPPDINRYNFLFDTAIQGQSLSVEKTARVAGVLMDEAKAVRLNELAPLSKRRSLAARQPAAPAAAAENDALAESLADAPEDESENGLAFDKRKGAGRGTYSFFGRDATRGRGEQAGLYQTLDKTREWVENNYYQLPIEQQTGELVQVNQFWVDFASHDPSSPFYSTNLAEASRNFTEIMLALAVLDLPFESPKHEINVTDASLTVDVAGPVIVYHQQIQPTKTVDETSPLLVSQNYFRFGDRYRQVNNERVDKFVTDEFLVQTVYGCQIVVTNPTSSRRRLDVLIQVPEGALPVQNGKFTRNVRLQLEPYRTHAFEYYFYFPYVGDFQQFPVQVAQGPMLVAHAEPMDFKVVKELSKIDRQSWDFVSQFGSNDDVLSYLENQNLYAIRLDRIAFRMADLEFFQKATAVLARRHTFDPTLWSYSIKHNEPARIREYLAHSDAFVSQSGSLLDSPLLTIDPVERHAYQHMEYRPLVNARVHQVGKRRQILNGRFHSQYHRWLTLLSYVRQPSDQDRLATVYYLLLQDRFADALKQYEVIDASRLATRLQYDYCTAYLGLITGKLSQSRSIAERYVEHPVERWRNAFALVRNQLNEIDGKSVRLVDDQNRDQVQDKLASRQPTFDFKVEAKSIDLQYRNLDKLRVNFYLMDIELLFSRNPFVQRYSGQFSYIQPNLTEAVELPADGNQMTIPLPASLLNKNVLVEVEAAGLRRSQAYYSNSLAVQVSENFGQLLVADANDQRPLPATYVKVYASMKDGSVRFYKDGYTDLRGRFDYTSLSTNALDSVTKFSVLVLSETAGALVREVDPPKR